jgi:hypothetical protein
MPTNIARSRCWNREAADAMDESISGFGLKLDEFLSVAFVENQNGQKQIYRKR